MNVLFVVAHPDDEVLGGGATIHKLSKEGNFVDVCVLNSHDDTVYENSAVQREIMRHSADVVGVRDIYFGDFTDSDMNSASHRRMVQFIEMAIRNTKPQIIFTHHPADINEDHRWVFQSTMEAFRLGQRQRESIAPVEQLLLMEVQSSTDWGIDPTKTPFRPNTFVHVSAADVVSKWAALKEYKGVLRECPHPRRAETIECLSTLRGSQAGYPFAEAFECIFRRGL